MSGVEPVGASSAVQVQVQVQVQVLVVRTAVVPEPVVLVHIPPAVRIPVEVPDCTDLAVRNRPVQVQEESGEPELPFRLHCR